MRFVCGDCAAESAWAPDGPLADTTVLWLCSTLFGAELMEALAQRIERASRVRVVATLRPFARTPEGFEEEEPPEPCEMSWTAKLLFAEGGTGGESYEHPGAPVHVYARTGPVPPRLK